MFARIAAFEFRYQLTNPVFWVAAILFFLFGYGLLASENVSMGGVGGNTHEGPEPIDFRRGAGAKGTLEHESVGLGQQGKRQMYSCVLHGHQARQATQSQPL